MKKDKKTNVMRILDANNIQYIPHFNIDIDDSSSRKRLINQGNVFKTLITTGKSNQYYVFVVPYSQSLDLKKAASIVNEKNLNMILQKDLLKITGYVHGGCSPIGMKKQYQTFIDETAQNFDLIAVSGGKRGSQVEVNSTLLSKYFGFNYADIT